MPRYMAVDYIAQAIQSQKSILSRLLITAPQHLEKVSQYPHSGILPDTIYRLPWHRAKQHDIEIHENLEGDLYILNEGKKNSPEHFVDFDLDINGTFEVIPSSNPESQEPLEDILKEINESRCENDHTKEKFQIEDLSEIITNLENGQQYMLEEMTNTGKLGRGSVDQMPQLNHMIKRLKPKAVVDPFTEKNNDVAAIVNIIKNDRVYDPSHSESEISSGLLINEKNEKVKLVEIETLEEELPLVSTPDVDHVMWPPDGVKDSLNLQPETINNLQTTSELMEVIINSQSSTLTEAGSLHTEKIHQSPQISSPQHDFTLMSSKGVEYKNEFLQKIQQESPASEIAQQGQCTDTKPWLLLKTISHDMGSDISLLTPNTKENLETRFWEKEKYFNDVLALRLAEPHLPQKTVENECVVTSALCALHIEREECGSGLELNLPWDPIVQSVSAMLHCSSHDRTPLYHFEKSHNDTTLEICSKYIIKDMIGLEPEDESISFTFATEIQNSELIQRGDVANQLPARAPSICDQSNQKHSEVIAPQDSSSPSILAQESISMQSHEDPLEAFINKRMQENKNLKPIFTNHAASKFPQKVCTPQDHVPEEDEDTNLSAPSSILKTLINPLDTIQIPKQLTQPKATPSPSKRSKCKVMKVKLTEEYVEILSVIYWAVGPTLDLLRDLTVIPQTQTFSALTPDVTHFILKQYEKSLKSHIHVQESEVHEAVITLHVLVGVADLLQHCTMAAALEHLKTNINQTVKGGRELNTLNDTLENICTQLEDKQGDHPKITAMLDYIKQWTARKILKSPEHDIKILLILRRDSAVLVQAIRSSLASLSNIKAVVYPCGSQPSYPEVISRLDHNNCVIMNGDEIGRDFPWAQFSLVLEYEASEQSCWLDLCGRQNIRYLGLITQTMTDIPSYIPTHVNNGVTEKGQETQELLENRPEFTFIVSSKVVQNTDLLHLLESRQSIVVVDRDYSSVTTDRMYYADVVIDERTGVLLQDLTKLSTDDIPLTLLIQRLAALQLKYQTCWLICYNPVIRSNNMHLSGMAVLNLGKIHAYAAQISNTSQYTVKVLTCSSYGETAEWIRRIGERACDSSTVWSSDQWMHRSWLTADMSKHEKFLLAFPCINSFSAQVLLSVGSLKQLLCAPLHDLQQICQWLPTRTLQMFHRLVNMERQLLLRDPVVDCVDLEYEDDGVMEQYGLIAHNQGSENNVPQPNNYHTGDMCGPRTMEHGNQTWASEDSRNTPSEDFVVPDIETLRCSVPDGQELQERTNTQPNEFEKAILEKNMSKAMYENGFYDQPDHDRGLTVNPKISAPTVPVINNLQSELKLQQLIPVQGIERIGRNNYSSHEPGYVDEKANTSLSYRHYPDRNNIKLWTQFGDAQAQKPKAPAVLKYQPDKSKSLEVRHEEITKVNKSSRNAVCEDAQWQKYYQPQVQPKSVGNIDGNMRKQGLLRQPLNSNHLRLTPGILITQQSYNRDDKPSTHHPWEANKARTPSIAPVTPKVRQASQEWDEGGTGREDRFNSVLVQPYHNTYHHIQHNNGVCGPSLPSNNMSPPMDLDSDEEMESLQWAEYTKRPTTILKNFGVEESDTSLNKDWKQNGPVRATVKITATTPKKRRLTYEAVPGVKGGQTRLSFG